MIVVYFGTNCQNKALRTLYCISLFLHIAHLNAVKSGADQGFFLGGGAPLRIGVTDWWGKQILKAYTKTKAWSPGEGGVAHPLHPPPRSASAADAAVFTSISKLLLEKREKFWRSSVISSPLHLG